MTRTDIAEIKQKAESKLKEGHAREFYRGQIAACVLLLEIIDKQEALP